MKYPAFLFLLLALSGTSRAQLTHRDILRKFTPQQLSASLIPQSKFHPFPQTPGEWEKILPDTAIRQLIRRGEKALEGTFNGIPATAMLDFVRTGDRINYETQSFHKRNRLWDLVLAESVEGKGRFSDQIVNGVWSICEESFWGVSAHVGAQKAGPGLPDVEEPIVDLFAAETAAVLAWTDYFAGPELDKVSKLVRPRIRYEIRRRILLPMKTAKYGWMGGGNPEAKLNNWAPWIISNYLVAVLVTEDNEAERAEDIYRGMKITDQYINGLGEDGGCEEGPTYWTAAGACVYDALNVLYDATGGRLNIYHDPFIRLMGAYIYKTHIAGSYFINVADAHPTLVPDGLMLYRFGKDMDDPVMMQFGSWSWHFLTHKEALGAEIFHRTRRLYNYSALHGCDAYPSGEIDVPEAWFSDVELMATRSADGLFLAAHGGNNGESHNHNDVGDFMVYANGQPVIIDVGSGTYTAKTFSKDRYKIWYNTSPYHNLPTVNGYEQGAGAKFAAAAVKYSPGRLSLDIAGAYPPEAGITTLTRTVSMEKGKGVVVADHYNSGQAFKSITQSFMTVCDADISQAGRIIFSLPDNGKVYLEYDAGLWSAGKEKMVLSTPEDAGLKHSWEGKDIWRILLTAKGAGKEIRVNYMIHK